MQEVDQCVSIPLNSLQVVNVPTKGLDCLQYTYIYIAQETSIHVTLTFFYL